MPLRGTGLLLSCSCSTSLDSAFFLQRRASLLIIETQISLWNVSDVDRPETVLFPGKTKTPLSGSFFQKKNFFEPFHLGEATLAWYALHLQEARQVRERAPHTHWLFIKLLWLMDKHAASADRVVNIDETSCRLLPVHETAT